MDELEEFDDFGEEVFQTINEDVDVENIIRAVGRVRDELEWLKKLKASRIKPIDDKVKKLKERDESLKLFILEAMDQFFPKKNSVDFPGVGKITKRKNKGKWTVEDEEKFIELIEKMKLEEDVIKTTKSVIAKSIPGVLAEIFKTKKEDEVDFVKFVEPENSHSVSFSFHKEEDESDGEIDF